MFLERSSKPMDTSKGRLVLRSAESIMASEKLVECYECATRGCSPYMRGRMMYRLSASHSLGETRGLTRDVGVFTEEVVRALDKR